MDWLVSLSVDDFDCDGVGLCLRERRGEREEKQECGWSGWYAGFVVDVEHQFLHLEAVTN